MISNREAVKTSSLMMHSSRARRTDGQPEDNALEVCDKIRARVQPNKDMPFGTFDYLSSMSKTRKVTTHSGEASVTTCTRSGLTAYAQNL